MGHVGLGSLLSQDGWLVVVFLAPAFGFLAAVLGIVHLHQQLRDATPARRTWLWGLISLLVLIVFGIGSCYGIILLS